MKALTIKQPWAWAIAQGLKDIENRSWFTAYRGPLAIHAGSGWAREGAENDLVQAAWAERVGAELVRASAELVRGAIVAVVDMAGLHGSPACARRGATLSHLHPDGPYTCSPWALGAATGHGPMEHWELTNVRSLAEPVPCMGRLGLWNLPADIKSAVEQQSEPAGQP